MSTEQDRMRRVLAHLKIQCEKSINESLINIEDEDTEGWCGIAWDDILCWNKTRPGTVVRQPCPAYVPRFNSTEFAERVCTENGTWWINPVKKRSWTNFNSCVVPRTDVSVHSNEADNLILLYTIGYSVSLVSLIVAVAIMLYWRRRHCKSITLHINLFLAFILRASMSFFKDRLFVDGLGLPHDVKSGGERLEFIKEGIHWECRTLFVMLMFAISASQTWMLMEGLYLYLLVHKTMATERLGVRPYVILGWVLPWAFLIPWIAVKSNYENTLGREILQRDANNVSNGRYHDLPAVASGQILKGYDESQVTNTKQFVSPSFCYLCQTPDNCCWNMQENPAFFWLLKGPWTAIVVINFFFFLDIIRVLITRVRDSQRHVGRSQYRKFGKFILVLIPLFGIMYIAVNVAFPSEVQGRGYNIPYLYVEMGYNSFQGFILALLFCFLNDDVHSEIRRSWQRRKFLRQNSNTFRRSKPQSSWHGTSKSSAISQTANHNGFNTSCHKRSEEPQTMPLRKSVSVYSTFVCDGTALVNGQGSRLVTHTQLVDNSFGSNCKDNGTKSITFL